MKEVRIGRAANGNAYNQRPWAIAFLAEIEQMQSRGMRIFTTTVKEGSTYVLMTASKDIHLRLGELDENGRAALASLIDKETEWTESISQMTLIYEQEGGKPRAILCTVHRTINGPTQIVLASGCPQ